MLRLSALLALLLPVAACSTPDEELPAADSPTGTAPGEAVLVSDARVRPTRAGSANTAAYMTLRNANTTEVRLVGVRAADVEAVELHETVTDGSIARMRPVDGVVIPAESQIEFAPGGYHVMLIGVEGDLMPGQTVPLTLVFADGPPQTLEATVTDAVAPPMPTE
jgi:copper(I)-binding protein